MTGWHTRIHGNTYRLTDTGKLIRHTEEYMTETERSEEHTSELQSRLVISYAVFCLKKKK